MEEIKRAATTKTGKQRRGIVITDGDIQILKFVHDYRLLRIEQLEALTGRTYTRVHRRLKGLFDASYIGRIERPLAKHIFYIKPNGLKVLLSEGLITDEEAARRVREGELKNDDWLDHELMIAEIHILLTLATRNAPFELVAWKEGVEIADSFTAVVDGQSHDIRIEPDAFFTLRDARRPEGNNRRSFLLEADRTTMAKQERPGSRRMNEKFWKYEYYIRASRPFEKHGVSAVRVLTITLKGRRRDGLAGSAAGVIRDAYRKYFLFGALEDIHANKPASVFDDLFIVLGDERRRPLMPLHKGSQVLK
jgi:hypothetical protein